VYVALIWRTDISRLSAAPPPPPPKIQGAAASRISRSAPANQPKLLQASRKTDGGAAEDCRMFKLSRLN